LGLVGLRQSQGGSNEALHYFSAGYRGRCVCDYCASPAPFAVIFFGFRFDAWRGQRCFPFELKGIFVRSELHPPPPREAKSAITVAAKAGAKTNAPLTAIDEFASWAEHFTKGSSNLAEGERLA